MANGNGNGKKKKRKRLLYAGGSLLALVLIVLGVSAATRGGTKIDPTKLAKVERGDLAKSVVATGKVEPITKVEIKSKASGIVKKLLVDAGDRVKKGQVLCELDRDEIEAQVNSARAQLLASQAAERVHLLPRLAPPMGSLVVFSGTWFLFTRMLQTPLRPGYRRSQACLLELIIDCPCCTEHKRHQNDPFTGLPEWEERLP